MFVFGCWVFFFLQKVFRAEGLGAFQLLQGDFLPRIPVSGIMSSIVGASQSFTKSTTGDNLVL